MRRTVAIAALMAGVLTAPAQASVRSLSRHPLAEDSSWQSYVVDQSDGLVYPQHVYVSGAGVTDPAGLEAQGGAVTTIHAAGQGRPILTLDLGIDTGGYVEVGIEETDGTKVHLGYSEARRYLTPDGDTLGDPSGGNDDSPGSRSDDFAATGRSPGIRGAERWISLELSGPGTVSIDYVRVREEHLHPKVSDYAGHFLSSDPQLNRIWYASAYTFAMDSFKDLRPGHDQGNVVVTDGAKRDRLIWLGDLDVENSLGDYSLRQAPGIVRDSLNAFSCQQRADGEIAIAAQIDSVCPGHPDPGFPQIPSLGPLASSTIIPEYTAWWVVGIHDYDEFTGDDAFARRMLPIVRRAIGFFESGMSGGLYLSPAVSLNWHPFDVAGGTDAHTNAVVYRALLDTADLERRLGDAAAAADDERRAAALRDAMVAKLWDPSAGAFLLNGLDPLRDHSQDAQVEALLDGVITGDRAQAALHFLDARLATKYGTKNAESDLDPFMSNYVSPYISSTELLARFAQGDTAGALSLLRREWGHMVDGDPGNTVWEKVGFDGLPASYVPLQLGSGIIPGSTPQVGAGFASLAHGWGGGPVAALSGYVLGIRPATPGFATWTVAPQVGDLSFAAGQAPTPHGRIVSRWQRTKRSFVLTVVAPRSTRGTVAVPELGAPRTLAMDGRVIWRGGRRAGRRTVREDGGALLVPGLAGRHTFAWTS